MNVLGRFLANCLAVVLGVWLLDGIHMYGSKWYVAIIALVIGLLNSFVKPILIFLTIPITIVTFGLFLLVINAGIIMMADSLLDGFSVDGFWWALLFSLIMWLLNTIVRKNEPKKDEYESNY